MAHANEGSDSFICHPHVYPQVEWAIPAFTPQPQIITVLGWYSFPITLVVGGWVGLGGLVKYWGGLPAGRRSPIPVLAMAAGNGTRSIDLRVTFNVIHLLQAFSGAIFTARGSYVSAVVGRNSVCPSVCLSVCHTRALWLIQRTYRRYFYTAWKGSPSFLPPNSGWWATSPST